MPATLVFFWVILPPCILLHSSDIYGRLKSRVIFSSGKLEVDRDISWLAERLPICHIEIDEAWLDYIDRRFPQAEIDSHFC